MSLPVKLSNERIKAEAERLGFVRCGMAKAEPVDEAFARHYRAWLEAGCQADMHYLENHLDKRFDPRLLVPGVRTVVSVAMNYYPARVAPGIAWYAQGKDYHDLLRERLTQLMQAIGAHGRCFVDTAPVPERYWAWRCGLGWIGKHSQLVVPHQGSAFFLGELFIEEDVDAYDQPMPNRCGRCRRCLDACPTRALEIENGKLKIEDCCKSKIENGKLACSEELEGIADSSIFNLQFSIFNSHKCLSYLTIENRGELPPWAGEKMGDTFYGCDRCLRACPHLHAEPTTEPLLQPSEALLSMTPTDWQQLTVEQYRLLFKGSAVKRAKYEGLMRNLHAMGKPQKD